MIEMLGIENVTIIGVLIIAVVVLWMKYNKFISDKQKSDEKEKQEFKLELKGMHEERSKERKEWLKALNENTDTLKEVAGTLKVIPKIQEDLKVIEKDVNEIKMKT